MASITLGQLKQHVQRLCGRHVDALRAEMALTMKLVELGESRSWSWRKKSALLGTIASHGEGTVRLNADPTKLDGTSTAFTAADIGSYIRIGLDIGFYQITGVAGQQLTLERAYIGTTFTGATYLIFRDIYSLASDFGEMEVPYFWNRLRETTLTELASWDSRRSLADIPSHFAFAGQDSSGNQQVRIWPPPSSAIGIRYDYLTNLSIAAGNSTRIAMRPDVLMYAASADALYTLIAEKPDRFGALMPLATRYDEKGKIALQEYIYEDQRRAGIPEAVQDYQTVEAFQNTFDISFDDSYL